MGQMLDAVYFAWRYPGSRQLILRRTMPELQATLIQTLLQTFPLYWFRYLVAQRTCTFVNGSVIRFGYCNRENDVYRYQSAEYDIIRFDELTHFSEHMYTYLLSRIRGANAFPKQVKSATNPGGVGHVWVKQRFIDLGAPDREHSLATGTRLFLPARVDDNFFLRRHDPNYKARLENLVETEKRALLYGEWNIADGRYFDEWNQDIHVVRPFVLPAHWQRYFTMDYGLDMLAGYWIAVDDSGRAYVYRELFESNHRISNAAERILEMTAEPITAFLAPPDLWNRGREQGRSAAEIFLDYGISLVKAPANRVNGWLELKEWLRPQPRLDGSGATARLTFFDTCIHAIRCIPALLHDKKNPSDCALEPHEYTHAPDAIRYFVASRLAEHSQAVAQMSGGNQLASLLAYQKGSR